ncbi:cytochrome P450 4V2 isoform X2 [Dermatophagoides farinae]|uniref:cytochrome P450 4V2 isoform X2 n=1 Tax=Dermatophagoides farinae TaxID=6954 RepID=UPI003F5F0EAB
MKNFVIIQDFSNIRFEYQNKIMATIVTMLPIGVIITAILVIIVNLFRLIFIQYRSYQYLKKIPGPDFRNPLLGNLKLFIDIICTPNYRPSQGFFSLLKDLSDEYGSKLGLCRVWFGPFIPIVVVTDANIAQKILNSEHHLDKATPYRLVRFVIFDGILTCNTEKWRQQKRELQPHLKLKALHSYLPNTKHYLSILNEKIDQCIKDNNGIFSDAKPVVSTFVLDVLGEFNSLSAGFKEPKFIERFERMTDLSYVNLLKPWTYFFRYELFNSLILFTTKNMDNLKSLWLILRFQRSVREIINNRVEKLRKNKDERTTMMLDTMIESRMDHNSMKVTNIKEIETHMNFFIIGGHDTTTTSLSWTLYLLGHHPQIQERLREEIDEYLDELEANDEQITLLNMKRLKYLECCILEALRLYPSAPIVGRRGRTPIQLDNGITLPTHVNYLIIISKILKDPKYFREPNRFYPERFLVDKDDTENWFTHLAYFPFSAGIRMCLGREYAMMQSRMLFINLVGNYLIKSLDNYGELNPTMNVLHVPAHFPIQFQRRTNCKIRKLII